jgi:hypothetical protein
MDSPKKASAPSPVNGDKKAYIGTADSNSNFRLSWYSGYGAANDRVWFGTSTGSLAARGSKVTAARRQFGQMITVNVNKNTTYYWQVKTDNNSIPSAMWSFTTVNWQCPLAVNGGIHHPALWERGGTQAVPVEYDPNWGINGPEWDHNGDCVLNEYDFVYFAKDWLNLEFGPPDAQWGIPVMGLTSLRRFANEWLDCYGRTNNGCAGW